jgi:drug/metabolite transporter (DMT)-like permease
VLRSQSKTAWLGTALLTASAVAYSTAGYFTRLIDLDAWTILFWRGLFAGLFLAGFIALQERRRLGVAIRAIGIEGLLVGLCSALATVCFLNAMRLTSVADVMVIGATGPFLTAALAWFLIGEREDLVTLMASLVALLGVAVMAGGALPDGRLLGDLLAFVMTALMALVMVLIRRKRGVSMLPAVCLSTFLCAAIVVPWARPLAAGGHDLFLLALFGSTQFGLGLLLLTLGMRLVSAPRAALINALDTPLAPLWVWLAFGEVPAGATLIGGLIVMAAVVGEVGLKQLKEHPREPPTLGVPHRQADAR